MAAQCSVRDADCTTTRRMRAVWPALGARLRLAASLDPERAGVERRCGPHYGMDPRDIASLIEQNLAGASAHVETDGQGHYEATVIAAAFAGKRSLQRHQLVYATLGPRVGTEIHALALKTYTPEEWAERGQ